MIWYGIHTLLTKVEMEKEQPIGKMVKVNGKNMHVYSKGEGGHTIVLMSGLGTAAPALDFEPIIDQMAENNQVVIVEAFGYGWSDLIDKGRSAENIIEELREALQLTGIQGPYILMPHSISGIYAMYYANQYPKEVEAIIGIDCTLPKQIDYFEGSRFGKLPGITKLIAPLGVSRLLTLINPDKFISENTNNIYSEENIHMQKAIASWKGYNRVIINEFNQIQRNIEMTHSMTFNKDLPLLFFTYETGIVREDGKTSKRFYEIYITNKKCQNVIVLEGTHYLHWTCSDEMVKDINQFLDAQF